MRKKSASGVLASLSGSPYRKSTIRPFARCGLAGRPFCASCKAVQRRLTPRSCGGYGTLHECFRNPLGDEDRQRTGLSRSFDSRRPESRSDSSQFRKRVTRRSVRCGCIASDTGLVSHRIPI
ncbi:MAG TPA: hypothetical protein DCQ94_06595 [Nitrospira sp.]|nr:hypothetical protein [Nitrospira sp.]